MTAVTCDVMCDVIACDMTACAVVPGELTDVYGSRFALPQLTRSDGTLQHLVQDGVRHLAPSEMSLIHVREVTNTQL